MAPPPKRALIVMTGYGDVFYDDGKRTGLFWSEAAHPYAVFDKEGFEVDFASEEGGSIVVDEHSLEPDMMDEESKAMWDNMSHPLRKALTKGVKKASDVNAGKYGIFFAAGGHGAMFDFPTAKGLQNIAADVYTEGGVVAAVCHGPAILPGIMVSGVEGQNAKTPLIGGKKITGFADIGETQLNLDDILQRNGLKTIRIHAEEVGASYVNPPGPWDDFVVTDGRIVTGVNPQSARSTAKAAVKQWSET